MSDLANAVESATLAAIADNMLKTITKEQQDALLLRLFSKALSDWEFKRTITEAVAQEASKRADEIIKTVEFQEKLSQAIKTGLERLLSQIPSAIAYQSTSV